MITQEKKIEGSPEPFSYEKFKIIIEQMEKFICQIKIGNKFGNGFLCKIPDPDNNYLLPVLITCNHIIDKSILSLKENNVFITFNNGKNFKTIELRNRRVYTNENYDITIIEIKKKKDKIENFLDLDDNINFDGEEEEEQIYMKEFYEGETIYILQYYGGKKLSLSNGILKKNGIGSNNYYQFSHKCYTSSGSSGSPILKLSNN